MWSTEPLSLSVENLHKRYGDVAALAGVSFKASPGEIVGLLGANGAGKTTCLECILGLREPDQGRVAIGDRGESPKAPAVRARIGAQLQFAALQDGITPREALRLFGSFYVNATKPDLLLKRFGLEEKAGAPFASLSGGQKQRLFLALAVVARPGLLVLDEPAAGLDPEGRREVHKLIRELPAEGCTILLSTHDLAEAAQLCDRVAILDRGRIIAMDTPGGIVARSSDKRRIRFRTPEKITFDLQLAVPSIARMIHRDGQVILETDDVNCTLGALVAELTRRGLHLLELEIESSTLEEVYLQMTSAAYPISHDEKGTLR